MTSFERSGWRWWIRPVSLAVLLLITALLPGWVWAQDSGTEYDEGQSAPLVTYILIDSSQSIGDLDSDRLREQAADYLIDFLEANSLTLGLVYRLGGAAFDEEIIDSVAPVPLGQVNLERLRGLIPREDMGTDFRPAIVHASNELRPFQGSGQQMAVVLFTDARPTVGETGMTDLDTYFEDLGNKIRELHELGARVFVVGIGDALEDRESWQEILRPDSTPDAGPAPDIEYFVSIDDPDDLYEVYSNWFSALIGLEAVGDAERLEEGSRESFSLPPVTEQVVVTAIKDDPEVDFILQGPDGVIIEPPIEQEGKGHIVYSIDDPASGTWEVTVANGGADYYVWQRPATAVLTAEPSRPTLDGQLLLHLSELSDRLVEAGDDLEVVLNIGQDGRTVISEKMEREQNGSFTVAFVRLRRSLTSPGNYEITISATINDQPFVLDVQPLTLEVLELPRIAEVRIDADPAPPEGEQLEVSPGQTIAVEVEVAHAELLGPYSRLTYDLPNSDPVEFGPDFETTAAGSRVYSTDIVLSAEAVDGPLMIRLEGPSIIGEGLNDDRIIRLSPIVVPPVEPTGVAPTVVPTVEPTPVPATPMPDPQPPPIFLEQRWPVLIAVAATLAVGLLAYFIGMRARHAPQGSYIGRREDNQRDRDDPIESELEKANESRDPDAADVALDKGLEVLELEEAIREKRVESWLNEYIGAFRRQDSEDIDWPKLRQRLGRHAKRTITRSRDFLHPLANQLVASQVWRQDGKITAIQGLYDLFAAGYDHKQLVGYVAEAEEGNVRLVFRALGQAITYPSAESFSAVQLYSDRSSDVAGQAHAAVYKLLADFYRSPVFSSQEASFALAQSKLRGAGLPLLESLLADVLPYLRIGDLPRSKNDWKARSEELDRAIKRIKNPKYAELPEASFLIQRLFVWKDLAEREKQFQENLQDEETLIPGKLLAEIRPSIDLFEPEEAYTGENLRKFWVPLIAYHVGDTALFNIEITTTLSSGDKKMSEGPVPIALKRGDIKSYAINLTGKLSDIEPTFISLDAHYGAGELTKILRPKPKYRVKELAIDPTLMAGKSPKQIAISDEGNDVYIVDDPLMPGDHSRLESLLDPAQEMLDRVKSVRSDGVQLMSLRGLRRTGKTTNLKTFCSLIRQLTLPHNARYAGYAVIELDLMKWFEDWADQLGDIDSVASINKTVLSQIAADFWRALLQSLIIELQAQDKRQKESLDPVRSLVSKLAHRTTSLNITDLANNLKDIALVFNKRLMMVLDEADLFYYFGAEETGIYEDLARLSRLADIYVVICHDSLETEWIRSLEDHFEESAKRNDQITEGSWYYRTETSLAEREEVFALLSAGSLEFTDLAQETVWVFTGGHPYLVQLVCKYIIQERVSASTDGQMSSLVSVEDVKDVVYDLSGLEPALFEYLISSFDRPQYALMASLARHSTNMNTGLLVNITYDEKRAEDPDNPTNRWRGGENLSPIIKGEFDIDITDIDRRLLQLMEMQIIEPVRLPDDGGFKDLVSVRWRIGWLPAYLAVNPVERIQQQLGASAIEDNSLAVEEMT